MYADMFRWHHAIPIAYKVNRIKDEQIGLPNVNIGLKGPSPQASAVDGRRTHPKPYSNPNRRPNLSHCPDWRYVSH